ncbi:hypothetical protein [Flavobacterium psychrotolerans]|uniref:Glycosyltransferase RgtA/B/C/D-like domain-containing protein n=1 Tax=Flavobacterium psychrotolerans TaxID=2169410 RepID=A0A2U1JFI9_9FLAO|nr:hypothetical protein [Flavobacterium psychrotolerans]PWA03890.1 hypothetical protein DB895_13810 [Flavobacterium psychrotolerans]
MKKIIDFVVKNPVTITAVLCFIFYFLPFKPKPFGDGEYHQGTIQLIDYILHGFHGNVRVDKGLLVLFYYFTPYSLAYIFHSDTVYYLFGIIFNSIFTCLAIHYLFKAFDFLNLSTLSKFWTLVILTLFPIHAYYAMGILAETAAFFAIALFIYAWVKIITFNPSVRYFLLLALSVILLVGTRPNLLPFLFLFSMYFLIMKFDWKYKIVFVSTITLFLVALPLIENRITPMSNDFKSTVFRNQLLWSRFELRDEPFNWLPQHGQDRFTSSDYLNNLKKRQELDSICTTNNYDKTQFFIQWVKDDIIHHPILTLRQYFFKFFQSQSFIISPLMKSDKSNWIKYGIHIYINCINYVLLLVAMWGMCHLIKTKKYRLFFPFLFLWGWSLVYVFVFHSEQRYMFPIRPVLALLFAYSLSSYFENKKKQDANP